jgi:type VI secretion system protein ImpL
VKRIALPVKKPEVWFWIITLLLLLAGVVLCWLVWQHPEAVGLIRETPERDRWLTGLVVGTSVVTLCALLSFVSLRLSGKKGFDETRQHAEGDDAPAPVKMEKAEDKSQTEVRLLKTRLRRRYGLFWRYKVRLLMVVGETPEITALAPRLAGRSAYRAVARRQFAPTGGCNPSG